MTTPSTTLTSLWMDGSPIKTEPVTPSKNQGSAVNKDFERFFKDTGLDPLAKQTGLIDGKGELVLTTVTLPQLATPGRHGHVITISSPSTKAILPKGDGPLSVASTPAAAAATSLVGLSAAEHYDLPRRSLVHRCETASRQAFSTPQRTPLAFASPSSHMDSMLSRKRAAADMGTGFAEANLPSESKRGRKSDKGGKGLRHFSMKVCEKVQKKGTTSYNEVADELVAEFTDPRNASPSDQQYDQKNIRRRVYDALNVLMAMNIISKEKKEIQWIGLPTNSAQECTNLELERSRRAERIRHKMQQLQELIVQQIAFKNLVQRNKDRERSGGGSGQQAVPPPPNSVIQLPFIIVNTSKNTVIDCSISNDKSEYLFNFNKTFEIHDDIEVLKRMGMALGLDKGQCSDDDLRRAVGLVPKALQKYVYDMAKGGPTPVGMSLPVIAAPSTSASLSHSRSADCEVSSLSRSANLYSSSGGIRAGTLTPDDFSDDEDDDDNSDSSSPAGGS